MVINNNNKLSLKSIQRCTCGAQLTKWLARAMSEPAQLWKIFTTIPNGISFLEAVVHNSVNFGLYPAHITWFGLEISYAVLEPYTLHLIYAIINLHRQRRTLFSETITNVYTIRYEKCIYNTLLEQHVQYALCALTCVAYYTAERRSMVLHFLQWKNDETNHYNTQTRLENISNAPAVPSGARC